MCNTPEQHLELCKLLDQAIRGREPIFDMVQVSALKFWSLEYRDRKHLYIWVPTGLTLSFEDYGSGNLQALIWNNIGLPSGISVYAPNSSALTPIYLKFTDEVIP